MTDVTQNWVVLVFMNCRRALANVNLEQRQSALAKYEKILGSELKVMLCFYNLPLTSASGVDFPLLFLALAEQESWAKAK